MSTRIIHLLGRVLNSFVLPIHSGVPLMLLNRVLPYGLNPARLAGSALYLVLQCAFLLTAPSGGRFLLAVVSGLCCVRIRSMDVLPQLLRAIIASIFQDSKEHPDQFTTNRYHGLMAFQWVMDPCTVVVIYFTKLRILSD